MLTITPPDMIPVKSSTIHSYGYREAEQLLFVRFLDKYNRPAALYRYFDVPPSKWQAFQAAGSKGEWFHENVRKPNAYRYERIG